MKFRMWLEIEMGTLVLMGILNDNMNIIMNIDHWWSWVTVGIIISDSDFALRAFLRRSQSLQPSLFELWFSSNTGGSGLGCGVLAGGGSRGGDIHVAIARGQGDDVAIAKGHRHQGGDRAGKTSLINSSTDIMWDSNCDLELGERNHTTL